MILYQHAGRSFSSVEANDYRFDYHFFHYRFDFDYRFDYQHAGRSFSSFEENEYYRKTKQELQNCTGTANPRSALFFGVDCVKK